MKKKLEQTLEKLIAQRGSLSKSALHSLEGGGRLRPLLVLATAKTLGLDNLDKAIVPACALEMVHTYSMIHDDLPCMDDDTERRGKKTLHLAFDEPCAILTGDFLLTYAFEVIGNDPLLNDRTKNLLITHLAKRAGALGMIGGQVLDLKGIDQESLLETHKKKTGALFTCALEFGAILANAPLKPFEEIGSHLGIAYQLVNDLKGGDGAASFMEKESVEKLAEKHFSLSLDCLAQIKGIQSSNALRDMILEIEHRARETVFSKLAHTYTKEN